MPYTPPSQLSPSVSAHPTPSPSRSASYLKGLNGPDPVSPASDRPQLPRSSSSYLTRQRRSPTTAATQNDRFGPMTDSQRGVTIDPHGSMRQSPPPVTHGLIPSGMTISPPDSSQNSDDEEVRGRSRQLENWEEELQAAISQIHVRRSSSPPQEEGVNPRAIGTSQDYNAASSSSDSRPPLSKEARKISHSRSSTDSSIRFEPSILPRIEPPSSYEGTEVDSDDSEESDGPTIRPPMLRKKSGELVRPALRPASRRRPSSMPGTPTYSKAVHFDSHLEHVRHFLQVDKPLAVSAGSSPVENYESESEFPFGSDESSARSRGAEWEIRLANFPSMSEDRTSRPVNVERIFLSSDNKHLIGTVAVQNLAFQKSVTARFTLDYWKTTSEIIADFNNDVRRNAQINDGLDRFNFSIKLADQANLENKTLFFCVRYNVNGQEFWDNNTNYNYQVDFTKRPRTSPRPQQPQGLGARPLHALPRSRPSPPASSDRSPIISMPVAFDDFGSNFDNFGAPFGQSPSILIGEPKIKLRSPKSKSELLETPMRRNKSTPMFGSRYDFNSSLSAAKNSAFAVLGESSGLSPRADAKQSSRQVPAVAASKSVVDAPQKQENGVLDMPTEQPIPVAVAATSSAPKPAALVSDKPSLTSQSYQELVDKYCFFGNNKSPPLTRTALGRLADGSSDVRSSYASNSLGSSTASAGAASPSYTISSLESSSAQNTQSSSPMPRTGSCMSSRSASPARFNSYFYPHMGGQTLLTETPTAPAIQG